MISICDSRKALRLVFKSWEIRCTCNRKCSCTYDATFPSLDNPPPPTSIPLRIQEKNYPMSNKAPANDAFITHGVAITIEECSLEITVVKKCVEIGKEFQWEKCFPTFDQEVRIIGSRIHEWSIHYDHEHKRRSAITNFQGYCICGG